MSSHYWKKGQTIFQRKRTFCFFFFKRQCQFISTYFTKPWPSKLKYVLLFTSEITPFCFDLYIDLDTGPDEHQSCNKTPLHNNSPKDVIPNCFLTRKKLIKSGYNGQLYSESRMHGFMFNLSNYHIIQYINRSFSGLGNWGCIAYHANVCASK